MKILCEYCNKTVNRKNNKKYHLKCYKEFMVIYYLQKEGMIDDYMIPEYERYIKNYNIT